MKWCFMRIAVTLLGRLIDPFINYKFLLFTKLFGLSSKKLIDKLLYPFTYYNVVIVLWTGFIESTTDNWL